MTARLAAALLLAAAVGGCTGGAAVAVDISVPRPLLAPLGVSVGVYFDNALKTYVHEEEMQDHGDYRIDIGASQAPVFAQVFEAMFDSVVLVDVAASEQDEADAGQAPGGGREAQQEQEDESAPAPAAPVLPLDFVDASGVRPDVDGFLAPSVEEVQFAIPQQTGGEFYEVWIRYRLQLYDSDGNPLSDWPLIGYGKANQRNYGAIDQREAGLNEATIWALRDAAALLSFQFAGRQRVPEVQSWLASLGTVQ